MGSRAYLFLLFCALSGSSRGSFNTEPCVLVEAVAATSRGPARITRAQAEKGEVGITPVTTPLAVGAGVINIVHLLTNYPHVEGLPDVPLVARGWKDHLQGDARFQELAQRQIDLAKEAGFTQFGFPLVVSGKNYFVIEYRGPRNMKQATPTREQIATLRAHLKNATARAISMGDPHLENFVQGHPVDFDGLRRQPSVEAARELNDKIFATLCRAARLDPKDFP